MQPALRGSKGNVDIYIYMATPKEGRRHFLKRPKWLACKPPSVELSADPSGSKCQHGSFFDIQIPRPPNVPLLRALWSLLDGIWGLLKGSWGVLVGSPVLVLLF